MIEDYIKEVEKVLRKTRFSDRYYSKYYVLKMLRENLIDLTLPKHLRPI